MPRMPTFKRKMLEWIEELEDEMLAEVTLTNYLEEITLAYRFAQDHGWPMDPTNIRAKHFREYMDHLEYTTRPGTQRQYLGVLLRFLRWSGNTNLDKVKVRISPARDVEWHSMEEIGLLIEAAPNPRARAMIIILAYTAVRVGGLARLKLEDVKTDRIKVFEKRKKERIVPVDMDFREEMEPYLAERERIVDRWGDHPAFLIHRPWRGGRSSEPYKEKGIYNAVRAVGKSVNLHTHPHKIRRTTLREMYFLGCPPVQLQRWAGHERWEQTVDYLGIEDADVMSAIRYRPDYLGKREKMYLEADGQMDPRPLSI